MVDDSPTAFSACLVCGRPCSERCLDCLAVFAAGRPRCPKCGVTFNETNENYTPIVIALCLECSQLNCKH